jgi:formylmethanofuran dehydrogenase subunit E
MEDIMEHERINQEAIQKTTEFHGHWCPGLAIGIRAAEWALAEMGKSPDEEIVAVVETDMCGVDAIQYLTGCTFGKGNLIHKDLGKNAFTFFRRRDNKSARLVLRPSIYGESSAILGKLHHKMQNQGLTDEENNLWKQTRQDVSRQIMDSDLRDVFEVKEPRHALPKKARIFSSIVCESCNEPVMETRTRRFNDQVLCISCFDELEAR